MLRKWTASAADITECDTHVFDDSTHVMQDEMLAHRLGLIPLNIDPRKLQTRQRECH